MKAILIVSSFLFISGCVSAPDATRPKSYQVEVACHSFDDAPLASYTPKGVSSWGLHYDNATGTNGFSLSWLYVTDKEKAMRSDLPEGELERPIPEFYDLAERVIKCNGVERLTQAGSSEHPVAELSITIRGHLHRKIQTTIPITSLTEESDDVRALLEFCNRYLTREYQFK